MVLSESNLTPVAIGFICIAAPLHLVCVLGTIFLRNTPAFAARGFKTCIWSLVFKALSCVFIMWLFLDNECPCVVAVAMLWVDWTANYWTFLKKVFLLWRYEIQAALNTTRAEHRVVELEKNIYVRFRQVLRPEGQSALMIAALLYVCLYSAIMLGVWGEYSLAPCLSDNLLENELALYSIIISFSAYVPFLAASLWCTRQLKKFPNDNWGLYTEGRIIASYSGISAIVCILVLSLVPTFDGIIVVFLVGSCISSVLHFLLPLHLHRKILRQLAQLEINNLTSFDRLLQSFVFLDAFAAFLKAEFSSENLFFWLEVRRLQREYACFTKQSEAHGETAVKNAEKQIEMLKNAAIDCTRLGKQCVGKQAPWQINISGERDSEMDAIIQKLAALLQSGLTETLQAAVEATFEALAEVNQDVYELLRKDPYPRFLLTSSAQKLNHDENFKRMLASEKLEEEAHKQFQDSARQSSTTGSRNSAEPKKEKKIKSPKSSGKSQKGTTFGFPAIEISETERRPSDLPRSSSMVSDTDFSVIEMPSLSPATSS